MNSDVTLKVLETALIRQDHGGMCKVPAETVEKCVEIMKNAEPITPIQGADDNDDTHWVTREAACAAWNRRVNDG